MSVNISKWHYDYITWSILCCLIGISTANYILHSKIINNIVSLILSSALLAFISVWSPIQLLILSNELNGATLYFDPPLIIAAVFTCTILISLGLFFATGFTTWSKVGINSKEPVEKAY